MELKEAISMHDTGLLSTDQFTEIVKENQQKGIFWVPLGKNQSRFGFLYHHAFHQKGRFFQNTLKKQILREINSIHASGITENNIGHIRTLVSTVHFSWRKLYDKNAFVYSDPRLIKLDSFIKKYISTNLENEPPLDHDFLFKVVDIALGIAKEDTYYRARLIDFLNTFRITHSDPTVKCEISEIELDIRNYITVNFQNVYPYKHEFMNQIVDIILGVFEDKEVIVDFVGTYRKTFPEMLIAPGEVDNIRRWH